MSVNIDMSEKEKVISDLVHSGDIPPIGQITDAQGAILIMLHQQNLNQSETNRIIFTKLDDAAALARGAKTEAEKSAIVGERAATAVEGVKDEFGKLNGKLTKTIERVASLEGIQEIKTKEEEKRALLRAGMKVIPTKVYNAMIICGNILLGLLAFGGAVSAVWWLICVIFNIHY